MLQRVPQLLAILLVSGANLLAQPAKEPKPGQVVAIEIAKDVTMKFCWIPAGEAQLGSTKEERDECMKNVKAPMEVERLKTEPEEVRGKFQTKGFWLGKYAVTQAEWTAVMGKNPSRFGSAEPSIRAAGIKDTARLPVETISWDDCQEFLKKLNEQPPSVGGKFALPHEDQWEYACRGGKGNKQAYYFGTEHNGKLANSNGEHPFGTESKGPALNHPVTVGSYEKLAPHPWGLCDMHGNMWQWCENKYSDANDNRVLRGGTYGSGCRGARSACRTGRIPAERAFYYGARLAIVP